MDKPKKYKVEYKEIERKSPEEILGKAKYFTYEGDVYFDKIKSIPDRNKGTGQLTKVTVDPAVKNLELSTGPIGKYMTNKYIEDFIATPKFVGDGRYGITKDVKKSD